MKTKVNLLKIATIVSYVFSVAYMFNCVMLYSIGNELHLLSLVLSILALLTGLFFSNKKYDIEKFGKDKTYTIIYIVFLFLNIVALPSAILCLISALLQCKDSYKYYGVEYKEPIKNVETTKPFLKRKSTILSFVSLGGILISALAALMVDTSMFSVKVTNETLTKQMTVDYSDPINGKVYKIDNDCLSYSYRMYVPKTASETHQVPTLFVIPGFTRTKETMYQYCIEMSRRGFACFVIDPGCQGDSTYAGIKHNDDGTTVDANNDGKDDTWSSSVSANGMNYLVQYVYNNREKFNFVDRNKFGVFGHSQGALNAIMVAQNFAGKTFEESIIKSLQISGYFAGISGRFQSIRCNACLAYGLYEEGYYGAAYETTALKFINNVNGQYTNNYDDIEINREYGNVSDGSYRILRREKINHCFTMYSGEAIENTINFFNKTLCSEDNEKGSNQVWWLKESFNGIMLVFVFMLIVNVSQMLINTKFFSSIKGEKAEEVDLVEEDGKKYVKKEHFINRAIFWLSTILTGIIACLDYMPLTEWASEFFKDATAGIYTFNYPVRMLNGVMIWAIVNGTIGLLIFSGVILLKNLYYLIKGLVLKKKPEYDFEALKPLKIQIIPLLKTLLLSVILFVLFYLIIGFTQLVFNEDGRFFMICAAPLNWRHFVAWLMYIPFFFIFYLSNSIRVNLSVGFQGFKEWQTFLVGALANSLGLVAILMLQYGRYALTGQCYWDSFLYINMVFGIAAMMALLPIMNRIFYKQTNKPYLGALVTVMIFIMMTLSASANFIPL